MLASGASAVASCVAVSLALLLLMLASGTDGLLLLSDKIVESLLETMASCWLELARVSDLLIWSAGLACEPLLNQ